MREIALSERERQVVAALGRGLVAKEIARELQVAESTVRVIATDAYRKLGVSDAFSAVRRARRLALI